MVELVDTLAWGASDRKVVEVQVFSTAYLIPYGTRDYLYQDNLFFYAVRVLTHLLTPSYSFFDFMHLNSNNGGAVNLKSDSFCFIIIAPSIDPFIRGTQVALYFH